ncbi:MAG: L-aspartate oxidase [Thermomicrobiales bacterium]
MQAALFGSQDLENLPVVRYDTVIIGAGVAGLTLALKLPPDRRVLLVTKGELGESNTRYAQGGLSAAVGDDDSPRLHEEDTLAAGAGLCDPAAVRTLVDGAPEAARWLIEIGAQFDRDAGGNLLLGREAAHSRRRVLHAGGDATGWEIERALVTEARNRDNITVWSHAFAIDLITESSGCIGVVIEREDATRWACLASATAIAAGGAGQIWSTTSNPPGATADGLAMAIRAGVTIADCEFVQFHPTVIALPGYAAFLVSEAVRDEGAYLRSNSGERFMVDEHPLAELAPRDVVARGIHHQLVTGAGAYLDLRHLDSAAMLDRFPTIAAALAERGVNLTSDLIPIAPAAHYFMGGVVAGTNGVTSMPGLFAIGEASCTGIHGANRLASNSLLEGLVFGAKTAGFMAERFAPLPRLPEQAAQAPSSSGDDAVAGQIRKTVQTIMTNYAGVERDQIDLQTAIDQLKQVESTGDGSVSSRERIESWNLAISASAIASAALHREESRGAQFRSDFPQLNPSLNGQHSLQTRDQSWHFDTLESAILTASERTATPPR